MHIMGASISISAFEFFNEIHVILGSGVFGGAVLLRQGLNTNFSKTLCVAGLTLGSMIYSCSSVANVTVTPHKVVLITGCDSGLGFSLSQHACDLGFTVVAGCLSLKSDGAQVLAKNYNNRIFLFELDITSSSNIQNAVITMQNFLIANEPAELWAVVNNAGVMVFGEFEWLTERLVKQQIYVNFLGTVNFTKAFLPFLRKSSGRIVTISSHCGKTTLPGLSIYGATKAALCAWNDGLRIELEKYGVSVINFIPGSFVQHSNIMSGQYENVQEMQLAMTEEQIDFYGEYFQEYNRYLNALSGTKKPKKIDDKSLYNIFSRTLIDKYPSAIYVHESLKYKFYHILFRILPYKFRDQLILHFMQMPTYKPENKINDLT